MIVRRYAELDFAALPGRSSADPFAGADTGQDTGGTSVRIVRLDPGPPRNPHRHPRSVEVVHVVSGSGRAWQDGESCPVAAGDTVLVPRGVPHATIPDPGGSLLLVCFFPDPDLATNLEELPSPTPWVRTAGGSPAR